MSKIAITYFDRRSPEPVTFFVDEERGRTFSVVSLGVVLIFPDMTELLVPHHLLLGIESTPEIGESVHEACLDTVIATNTVAPTANTYYTVQNLMRGETNG